MKENVDNLYFLDSTRSYYESEENDVHLGELRIIDNQPYIAFVIIDRPDKPKEINTVRWMKTVLSEENCDKFHHYYQ